MVDRVFVDVHLDRLWHNYQLLKSVHQDKEVMAVVKADAYGHGACQVANYLESMGCSFFVVTDMIEGIELRDAGIKSPILILGKTSPEHAKQLNHYRLTQTVDGYEYARQLNAQAIKIDTHIIIDTGMSRFGILAHHKADLPNVLTEIKSILHLEYLNHQGIYTHFAVADESNDAFTKGQYAIFNSIVSALEKQGFNLGIRHCSNSASTLKFPEHTMDMVRVGIAMYGYPPVLTDLDFKPVMDVYAKVIALRDLKKGEGISYGLTYKTIKPMRVASIAIGYADGYNRLLSNQDYFIYQNHRLPVVGRVCMGVTMVDVTGLDIQVGDQVQIFGQDKSLEQMAKKINTITYELLTNMSKKRIHFNYIKKGK